MKKYFIEWDGKKFPVREVMFNIWDDKETIVKVADYDLWYAIEPYFMLNDDARAIDNSIYFYCVNGFIASDPTDEEIIDHLIKNLC